MRNKTSWRVIGLILVGLLCVCGGTLWAEAKPEPAWVSMVRQTAETPPSRPRRVMLVFPLTEPGSKEGKIGWDRGLVSLQAMWLSSFAPDRVMDTWDFHMHDYFADQQLLGAGRVVTPEKVKALCAAMDTRNYVTGALQVTADSYVANLTFQGENGTKPKTYDGRRADLHTLPCRIAQDVIGYLGIALTPEQERAVQEPPLQSVELFDEAADHVPALYCFATDYEPYWRHLLTRCRTTWTEYMYLTSASFRDPTQRLDGWGKFVPQGKCAVFDFCKGQLAFQAAKWRDRSYDGAGEALAPLLASDPYNPDVPALLARTLSKTGWPELAKKVADRYFVIYKDSLLGPLRHGEFLIEYAWDARGGGWARTVTEEGWKLFGERLNQARAELERVRNGDVLSWQARNDLIPLAMGLGLPRRYAMEQFEAAVAICPTAPGPYRALMYLLEPKWGGSIQEMLSFGRRCAKTEFYGTKIPALLAEAHWTCAGYRHGQRENASELETWEELGQYFKQPEVWTELEPVLRRTTDENPDDLRDLTYYLLFAYYSGHREVAARLLERTQGECGNGKVDRYDMCFLPQEVFARIKNWVKQGATSRPRDGNGPPPDQRDGRQPAE